MVNTFDNTPSLALKGSRFNPLLNHDFNISSEIFRLNPVRVVEIATTMAPNIDITANQLKTLILNNALVTFGPGADVLSMLHPSDYSAIRFSFPRAGLTAGQMAMYLHSFFDETVGVPRVHMITTDADEHGPVVAHVQVQDPTFAARVQGRFNRYLSWRPFTKMSIAQVPVEMRYESGRPSLMPAGLELQLLQDRYAMIRLRDRPAAPECAVCMTEAEEAIRTPCRHSYCRTCFVAQCSSIANKSREIPLRCLGDSGTCSRIFLLPELERVLDPSIFQHLLSTSFLLHLKTISTIKPCPTPDCDHQYRSRTDGLVLICPRCSNPICTTCQTPSHAGITCRTYPKTGKKAGSESWWVANDNEGDIRKCPRCRNLVEKIEGGCRRVTCGCCRAGFCWECMEVWDEGGWCRCVRKSGMVKEGL